jgi:hypothetical protein
MSTYDDLSALADAYELADWLLMKEGVRVAADDLYRQTKPVLSRLCGSLGLPTEATRAAMIAALKCHEFTEAQRDEKTRCRGSAQTSVLKPHVSKGS